MPELASQGESNHGINDARRTFAAASFATREERGDLLGKNLSLCPDDSEMRVAIRRRIAFLRGQNSELSTSLSPSRRLTGNVFCLRTTVMWGLLPLTLSCADTNNHNSAVQRIGSLPIVADVWKDALHWSRDTVAEAGCVHWTLALELCMDSLAQCRVARRHMHVCLNLLAALTNLRKSFGRSKDSAAF